MSIVKSDRSQRTVGLAAKVAWPAVVLFLIGAGLIVAHFLLDDDYDNTLLHLGLAAIGASGVTTGLGWQAPAALQTTRHDVARTGTTYQPPA
jgi:hypothetical protein